MIRENNADKNRIFFTFDFAKRFRRAPALHDNLVLISTLYRRNPEIKDAISRLGFDNALSDTRKTTINWWTSLLKKSALLN